MSKEFFDSLKNLNLQYSIVVKSLKTNFLCMHNEKVLVPSASTIKLFVMGETFRMIEAGKLNFDDKIRFEEKYSYEDDVQVFFPGEIYPIKDFITQMIINSHNGATNILIDLLGMEKINYFIESLNIKNTVLERKMLDFEARKAGKENITTAYDLRIFLEKLYFEEIINGEYSQLMIEIMKNQKNKSKMRRYLPKNIVIANKTGELEGIEHDAGIVYTHKGDYIFVMLTWDCKDYEYSRHLIGKVSNEVFEKF